MKEAGLEGKALPPTSATFQVTQAFSAQEAAACPSPPTLEQDSEGQEGKEGRFSNPGKAVVTMW